MRDRIRRELKLVERAFGELERGPNLDWFVVKAFQLGAGWNKPSTSLLVLVPAGYPTIPPDNFHVDRDLRLASGALPGNTSTDQQAGNSILLLFSFHIESGEWRPGAEPEQGHNLVTFLEGVRARLTDCS